MHSKKSYGMPALCRWALQSLGYDGMCSHIPLIEVVHGEHLGLTEEQIEAKANTLKQRRKAAVSAYQKGYYANIRIDPEAWQKRLVASRPRCKKSKAKAVKDRRFACDPCDMAFPEQKHLDRHLATQKHRDNLDGLQKPVSRHTKLAKDRAARDVASKKFYCRDCNVACKTNGDLKRHRRSEGHAKRTNTAMPDKAFRCNTCNKSYSTDQVLVRHYDTDAHKKAVAAASSSS